MRLELLIEIAGSILAAMVYFLPAVIADRRGRHDRLQIALCNALFGWTVIGWVLALYWAYLPNPAATLVSDVMANRRTIRMRTFSTKLLERVQRRIAAQDHWVHNNHTPH